jgi:hypothetical protein
MAVRSIVRAKGGTCEREVLLSDITVTDIRTSPLFLPDERWVVAVSHYYNDLNLLLAAVRVDLELPSEFFVPDLWDTAIKLPAEESEQMLDMWYLGRDLAESVGYTLGDPLDFIRNGVGGSVYLRS